MRKEALEFPKSILIETSNKCQGLCKFCPYSKIRKNDGLELMDEKVFYYLIDEISKHRPKRITLFNNNEPLLDKRIFKFIEYVYENNKDTEITLSTNGIILTKEILNKLHDSHLTTLYVSIPTIDEEKYEYLMGVKPFKLFKLLESIDDNSMKKMIRIAVPETKYYDKESMKAKFGDYLICSWPLEYKGSWQMKEEFEKFSLNMQYAGPCDRPLDQAVISSNGDVIICCRDWSRENVVGNINYDSLYNIWKSDKMKKIQNEIINNNYNKIKCCSTCSLNYKYYKEKIK